MDVPACAGRAGGAYRAYVRVLRERLFRGAGVRVTRVRCGGGGGVLCALESALAREWAPGERAPPGPRYDVLLVEGLEAVLFPPWRGSERLCGLLDAPRARGCAIIMVNGDEALRCAPLASCLVCGRSSVRGSAGGD